MFVEGMSCSFSCVCIFICTMRLNMPLHTVPKDMNLYFIYLPAHTSWRYSHLGRDTVNNCWTKLTNSIESTHPGAMHKISPLKRQSQSQAPPSSEHAFTEDTHCQSSLPAKVPWPVFFGRESQQKIAWIFLVLLVVKLCLEVKLPFPQDFIIAVTTGLKFCLW